MRLAFLLVCLAGACYSDIPELPDIWTVVEDSYNTQVLATFPDLRPGVTMEVWEYYEISEQKGVVNILEHGLTTQTNYYTSNEQVYVQHVEDNTCEVGGLIDNAAYHLWGWDYPFKNGTDVNFVYGPTAILKLIRDYEKQLEYMGEEDVRGIISDKWQVLIPNRRGNYTLYIYFASDKWLMPYGHTLDGIDLHTPVQIKVHGPEMNPWDSAAEDIVQTVYYDYINFQPFVDPDDEKKFLTIDGLDCKGRYHISEDYEPPLVPSVFDVFLETIIEPPPSDENDGLLLVFKQWLYYDEPSKMLRVDMNPDSDSEERAEPSKIIHDYLTGISYNINKNTGACRVRVLDPDDFGNMIGGGIIGDVIMAKPGNLFHLDDTYTFTGLSNERSLLTERWTSTRDDIRNPFQSTRKQKFFKKAVVDYQFLRSSVDDPNLISSDDSVPIRVDVTVYDDDNPKIIILRQKINFMMFSSTLSDIEKNHFDVRECYTLPSQRTYFKIPFVGQFSEGIIRKEDIFKAKVIAWIAEGTGSSLIRFPEIQLNKDDEEILTAIVLVLEPAPYHLQFKQQDDMIPTNDDEQLGVIVDDVDICAALCLTYTHFACKSFYECVGLAKNCFLSNYGSQSPGTPIDVPKACKHYKKALVNKEPIQEPNSYIKDWIQNKINHEQFNITVNWHFNGTVFHQTFMAVGVTEELLGDDPVFVDLVRDDFSLAFNGGMLRYVHSELSLQQISYAACLLSCTKQKSFECETMSYCYGDSNCWLSSYVVDNPTDPNDVARKQNCVIISKSHLNDYQRFDGAIFMEDSKAKIVETSDANKCAYYCTHREDFTCRAFDYCSDTKDCWLFDKHSLDFSDSLQNTTKSCSHFSRNELSDFEKHPNQILKGSRDRYISDISVERCAHECVKDPEFGCLGFDFCNNIDSVTCFLTQEYYSDDGVVIGNDPSCDHYSREYFEGEDRDHFINHHKKGSNYIYGPGDMAGLGVSMLVLSIAGTFAGFYLYHTYNK